MKTAQELDSDIFKTVMSGWKLGDRELTPEQAFYLISDNPTEYHLQNALESQKKDLN